MELSDGTRLTAGLDVEERNISGQSKWFPQYAYVVSVYPIDHVQNISKFRVECDLVLKETDLPLLNVPIMQMGDGFNNFDEWYPEPATKKVLEGAGKSTDDKKTNFDLTDGDEIVVMFINGNVYKPIILGSTGHPQSDEKATIEDGNRRRKLINNIRQTINKDGEFEFETKYPNQFQRIQEKIEPEPQKGVKFQVLKDNSITLKIATTEEEKFIEINILPATKTISTKLSDQYEEILNYDTKKHEIKYGSAPDITQEVDWTAKKFTIKDSAGDAQIIMDFASKEVKLDFMTSYIGKLASFSALLGEQTSSYLASHFHNAPQAPSGVLPTTPPTVPPSAHTGTALDIIAQFIKLKGN